MSIHSTEQEREISRVLASKIERRAYYDKIAPVYDLLSEMPERAVREAGLAKFAARPGERVLEIGVGTGHCLVELAEAVGPKGRALGIDISRKMVDRTRRLINEEHLAGRADVLPGDGEHLPYASDTIDGIFMSFTLELFDTPEIPCVLAECRRVLRPGGRIVIVAISKEGHPGLRTRIYEWTHRHFPNLLDCRPIYVRRALEAAGFAVEDSELHTMWVPVEVTKACKPAA